MTANATSKSSITRWLQDETDADVIFLQEVGARPSSRVETEQASRKDGWKVAFNPNALTDKGKGGLSGGAALTRKRHVGTGLPLGPFALVGSHCAFGFALF